MERFGKIYLISNDINNKLYVGQTTQTLAKRFRGHCCYSKSDRSKNMHIKRAIHKYGKDKFHISLLEICPIELINEREEYWISLFNSYKDGYNLTLGGQKSNNFSLHKLEKTINIKEFKDYVLKNTPFATDVAAHFGICKCSVYNLIKRLNDPNLILNSYNPRKPKSVNDIDSNELIKLYLGGWCIRDLEKKYHIQKNFISSFLKLNGIKIRRSYVNYKHRI